MVSQFLIFIKKFNNITNFRSLKYPITCHKRGRSISNLNWMALSKISKIDTYHVGGGYIIYKLGMSRRSKHPYQKKMYEQLKDKLKESEDEVNSQNQPEKSKAYDQMRLKQRQKLYQSQKYQKKDHYSTYAGLPNFSTMLRNMIDSVAVFTLMLFLFT